jgi:phage N-6-adenine-methyltransferase
MKNEIKFGITTDKDFKNLIPPLTKEELQGLEESVLRDGCIDPLVVWQEKNILLDGHNRKEICEKYGIDYNIRELKFDSRDEAADWIDAHQLGRRNLRPEQISLLRGRRYNRQKKKQGGTGFNQHTEQRGKFCPSAKTSEKIAKQAGVSPRTIKNDGRFAEAVNKLKIENEITKGLLGSSKNHIVRVASGLGADPSPKQLVKAKEQLTKPHIVNNSGDNEWYTPAQYIEPARNVMGGIDLDPASCGTANNVIKAERFYSIEDNGLSRNWKGRVWMNPPYAQPNIQYFIKKLVHHFIKGDVPQAMVLVNNATETKWGQLLLQNASAICFPSGRIKFWHPQKVSAPLQGQMVVYFGDNTEQFGQLFNELGAVFYGK